MSDEIELMAELPRGQQVAFFELARKLRWEPERLGAAMVPLVAQKKIFLSVGDMWEDGFSGFTYTLSSLTDEQWDALKKGAESVQMVFGSGAVNAMTQENFQNWRREAHRHRATDNDIRYHGRLIRYLVTHGAIERKLNDRLTYWFILVRSRDRSDLG